MSYVGVPDPVLVVCEGCGCQVVFRPQFIEAHDRSCPAKMAPQHRDREMARS